MIMTLSILEMNLIINCVHGDPHCLLGMHEITIDGENALVVRAFIPQAKRISVIDPKDGSIVCKMEKLHIDGFFEKIIKRDKWFRYKFRIEGYEGNFWECYDAYSFEPQISEFDTYLFGQGTHYEIFEKLGAHIKTVDGVKGALFAVWAPRAERVSVVGNFNCWDGRRSAMRVLGGSGVWELFIPGVSEDDIYKFEIKPHGGATFQKSDPYANFAELRPSTSSVVSDISIYKWHDEKWLKNRDNTNPLENAMNIYEIHFGSWRKRNDGGFLSYKEMADILIPYVVEMGYTHIEIMPIMEYPFDGSWGYQSTGYFAPTSRYGSPREFMYFIDKCHENNIGVILDWVPAHFPKDVHGLAQFDGSALYEYEDPMRGEHIEWGTLIFDFGRNQVKNFLISNAIFWVEKYHIDGLRVDAVAAMLYLDYNRKIGQWAPNHFGGNENFEAVEFLRHLNDVMLKRNPGILMIAEESTAWHGVSHPVSESGLGFSFKWNMGFMNDFLAYVQTDPVHRKFHHNNLTFGIVYAYTENFILVFSHDEVVHGKRSLINKMPGDLWQKCSNLKTAFAFMYGHPGKKLLFMGGEFGQFIEWDEKKELDWMLLEFEHHQQIQLFVKDLNILYKNERALWCNDYEYGSFEWISCNDADRSLVTFLRKTEKPEEMIIMLCNFSENSLKKYRMGVPFYTTYKEILNSDDVRYGGKGIVNKLPIKAESVGSDGCPYSIVVDVPALGSFILKQV